MFEHPAALRTWVSVNVSSGGELEVVLMVETALPLDPQDPHFNDEDYNSLTSALSAYTAASEHFDRAVVLPASSRAESTRQATHHLAGWRFSVQESHFDEISVSVIDIHNPDFHAAQDLALRQFAPGSIVTSHFPLSEEVAKSAHAGASEKWIPLRSTPGAHLSGSSDGEAGLQTESQSSSPNGREV